MGRSRSSRGSKNATSSRAVQTMAPKIKIPRGSQYRPEGKPRRSVMPMKISEIDSEEAPIWERIPRTREDWMQFMVQRIRSKAGDLKMVSDRDIEATIIRARGTLYVTKKAKIDPNLPDCYYWSMEQVGEWIEKLGFPEVKEMFLKNFITGRKLITVDASALNQMGLTDLTRISEVTSNIRSILEILAPNALRAVMRIVPIELYLNTKSKTGLFYDNLTFKKFCDRFGFDWKKVLKNKTLSIPPGCDVQMRPSCQTDPDGCTHSSDSESEREDDSINYAPTCEFVVRTMTVRDRLIREILDAIMSLVIKDVELREAKSKRLLREAEEERRNPLQARVRRIFARGFLELGIEAEELAQERVEFIASVAEQLVEDILRSRKIIGDLEKFSGYLEHSLEPNVMRRAQRVAEEVFEQVCPIATLLAYGQLELETMIRDAPGIRDFVEDIIHTAEDEVALKQALGSDNKQLDKILGVLSDEKVSLAKDALRRLTLEAQDNTGNLDLPSGPDALRRLTQDNAQEDMQLFQNILHPVPDEIPIPDKQTKHSVKFS